MHVGDWLRRNTKHIPLASTIHCSSVSFHGSARSRRHVDAIDFGRSAVIWTRKIEYTPAKQTDVTEGNSAILKLAGTLELEIEGISHSAFTYFAGIHDHYQVGDWGLTEFTAFPEVNSVLNVAGICVH